MNSEDLTGKIFGRLTVVNRTDNHITASGKAYSSWLCKCECGNEIIVLGRYLRDGTTQSCGCLQLERTQLSHIKHGGKHERLYAIWDSMKQRCYNTNHKYYHADTATQ